MVHLIGLRQLSGQKTNNKRKIFEVKYMIRFKSIFLCTFIFPLLAMADARPRLLVLTDIGGDPDDMQSMRRLMLYSNEFRIEGLIASAAGTPG